MDRMDWEWLSSARSVRGSVCRSLMAGDEDDVDDVVMEVDCEDGASDSRGRLRYSISVI